MIAEIQKIQDTCEDSQKLARLIALSKLCKHTMCLTLKNTVRISLEESLEKETDKAKRRHINALIRKTPKKISYCIRDGYFLQMNANESKDNAARRLYDEICQGTAKSHLILSTKAGSESSSFYYINNVILFHNPTVPETFTQIVGRITRVNTIFESDDLHVWIFRSDNIDLYKLGVVCHKAAQAEIVVNEEKNIPDEYKEKFKDADVVQMCKKYLLWEQNKSINVSSSLID